MSSGMEQAVQGYLDLAKWWLDAWGPHVTEVAERLETGPYTADAGAADLAECARLAAEGALLLANEAFDAAAVVTANGHRSTITSRPFSTTTYTVSAPARSLRMEGPLVPVRHQDSFSASQVRIVPSSLSGPHTQFVLEVDPTGHRGDTYRGKVGVYLSTGKRVEIITVLVCVS